MLNRSGSTSNAKCLGGMEDQEARSAASAHFQGNNKVTIDRSQMPAAHCPARRKTSQPPAIVSLVDLLRVRAAVMGEKRVFSFLRGDGAIEASLTYRGLHERTMAIGGELQSLTSPGDRVLLLFPAGLGFIEAFFGCLYAGVVAVPAAPPSRHRSTSSVEAIIDASEPSLILSTAEPLPRRQGRGESAGENVCVGRRRPLGRAADGEVLHRRQRVDVLRPIPQVLGLQHAQPHRPCSGRERSAPTASRSRSGPASASMGRISSRPG